MAKYDVKHACGHTHEYQLFGKTSERERKLEWLATQECPECRKAREAREAAMNAAQSEYIGIITTNALTGSEKQIAWAETLRALFVGKLDKLTIKDEMKPKIVAVFAAKTEARYWIDRRGLPATDYLRESMKEIADA